MFSNEAFAQNAEKYMDTVFRVAYGSKTRTTPTM